MECKFKECKRMYLKELFEKRKKTGLESFGEWLVTMWKKRLALSLVFLNVLPLLYFYLILCRLGGLPSDLLHTFMVFWLALGVFAFYRVYHALVAWRWRTLFCDVAERLEEERELSFDCKAHLFAAGFYILPGLIYLVLSSYLPVFLWIWWIIIAVCTAMYLLYS